MGKQSKPEGWKCDICNKGFPSKVKLFDHKHEMNHFKYGPGRGGSRGGENQFTKAKKLGLSSPEVSKETREKQRIGSTGRFHSEETKKKISDLQKKAIDEGRNHGWMNYHSSERSYAEKWFAKVIQNEFEDQNVTEQLLFGPYRLDFAWKEKKKCIEIDGKQHWLNPIQIESDKRKDKFLQEKEWKVFRVQWRELMFNTKETLQKMKNFIE